ncbi:hypothetical protein HDU96_004832 [Phlyctochytrium bullatum]|nr:hypothetical protein HDU96_004832 [Phlyctochytrium bullatum]
MAAPPPQKTPSAHEDVMQFLEDLDSLNLQQPTKSASSPSPAPNKTLPSTTSSSAAASSSKVNEVLSFLDELNATTSSSPTKPSRPASSTVRSPSKPPTEKLPSAATLFGGSDAVTPTDGSSAPPHAEPVPATAKNEVPQTSQQTEQPAASDGGGWGWATSLWSQAQATASKATAAAASSLTMAQHIVEDASKVVTTEKMKGLVANVSKDLADSVAGVVKNETVQKVGSEFSKFTMSSVSTISDILAPPISPTAARAYVRRRSTQSQFARTVTVWLCAQPYDPAGPSEGYPSHDQIHDYVQATGNALWITDKPQQGICSKLVVNGVANPDPTSAKGLKEAIDIVEATLQKLSKFADLKSQEPERTVIDKVESEDEKRVFLIVQPFVTLLASQIFGAAPHIQFVVLLVCPSASGSAADVEVVTVVSQSVKVDTDGTADEEAGPLARWHRDQIARVIETAITDAFEEFAVRCQLRKKEKVVVEETAA